MSPFAASFSTTSHRCALGLEPTPSIPPVHEGHKGPFLESDGMEVVETEKKTTTAAAATDIATAEAGTAIVTGTGPGNTAVMITNADAVTKIETKTAVVVTVTVRETRKTTENDEGRGKKT